MKKILLLCLLCSACLVMLRAQIQLPAYQQQLINRELYHGEWKGCWIAVPNEPSDAYGVYLFRKTFEMADVPASFVIHASADNRYKLYVNGELVSLGPVRSDIYNWSFETIDIAFHLKAGKNVLAAEVWNYAADKPAAQMSANRTGFLVQGNTEAEQVVNTNATWLCIRNKAYSPNHEGRVLGYFVVGPGEVVNMVDYPFGWNETNFDDSAWLKAAVGRGGAMKGARDYPERQLVPASIPQMEMRPLRFATVRQAEGVHVKDDFLQGVAPLTVPAHTTAKILIDQQQLTTGYPTLQVSQGYGSTIRIGYAESLYQPLTTGSQQVWKGNRNEVKGKQFIGYEDKLFGGGVMHSRWTSLWWRTWRYIELNIQTTDEPLIIEDIYSTTSSYPFRRISRFEAQAHPELNQMLDIGWHTARLCANETYMDCPYYEQLQYFGDTRIQTMITMYNTADTMMVRQAIEQGRRSLVPDGLTMSRFPSSIHQFISSYSLSWIGMGYDYWMYRGDENYIRTLLPAFRSVLAWYEQWIKPDGSLGYVPFWFFADWSKGFSYGEPVREATGNSAYQDLCYLLALEEVAAMEQALGIAALAEHYRKIGNKIRMTFRDKYWDAQRGLFADTYDRRSYSQHVNALAILAGITHGVEAKAICERMLADTSLIQATIYFRYFVHQALDRAGLGDQLLDHLQIWRDQMALGLTTWAEEPEPSRSDCHAWGASLNVEFFRIVLGIHSAAPGFKKVLISPALGKLQSASGTIPHPEGEITVSYNTNGNRKAVITLPKGVSGRFVWKGKTTPIHAGRQEIDM